MPSALAPTPLSRLLGSRQPLVLAGMGGMARPDRLAAMIDAGGFGLLDMMRQPPMAMAQAVHLLRQRIDQAPFGISLLPALTPQALLDGEVAFCVNQGVPVVGLYGDVHPHTIAQLRSAGITVIQQVCSAEEALQAQEAGAHILLAQGIGDNGQQRAQQPIAELLSQVLPLVHVPVMAAGGLRQGQDMASMLAQGAQGAVLDAGLLSGGAHVGELLHHLLAETASHAALLLDAPATPLASPVCYAAEAEQVERERLAPLIAELDTLLEAERAGARVTLRSRQETDDPAMQALIDAIHHDEVHWCGVLLRAIRHLGATPGTRTGDFYEKTMAIPELPARLAFLNRGQGWVARKLRDLIPQVSDELVRTELQAMLESHQSNLSKVNQHLGLTPPPSSASTPHSAADHAPG